MRIFIKIISCIIYIVCLSFTLPRSFLNADTVHLKDGSLLVGKVTGRYKNDIQFKNYYGVFKIKHTLVDKLYITHSYEEDIKIHKDLGKSYDEEAIKRNYLAGLEDPKDNTSASFNYRISFLGSYYSTLGDINQVIPYGYGGHACFEVGSNPMMNEISGFIHMMRFEVGYLNFSKDTAKINGISASAGPEWFLPFFTPGKNRFVISALVGMSLLNIEKEYYTAQSNTLTVNGILGYEHSFWDTSIFIHGRYMYIYDKIVSFHNIGAAIGINYKI